MVPWCSSDNSRLLRLSCCTALLQNTSLHTASGECNTGLDLYSVLSSESSPQLSWDHVQTTQGIPCFLRGSKKIPAGGMKSWDAGEVSDKHKTSLREAHVTEYTLCYRSVVAHNSLQDNCWSKCCKIIQLKAQKWGSSAENTPPNMGCWKRREKSNSLRKINSWSIASTGTEL